MRFHLFPAAYVLLLRGTAPEVLLRLRSGTRYRAGHWAAAAEGHVDEGESVIAAARREAAEALGVTIAAADLIPLTTVHRTYGNGEPIDERVDFYFSCRVWQGEPRRHDRARIADLRWFPLTDLPDPVVPNERRVLEGLRANTLSTIMTDGFRCA